MKPRALASIAATCMLLGGCGGLESGGSSSSQTSNVARAQATHEYSAAPPAQSAIGGAAAPEAAIYAFAMAYVNWDADNVSADMRSLAARSIGQARAAVQLAAAQTAGDYELRRGGISNRGRVEAIAPLIGHRDEYAVVTRERTSATNTTAYQGLKPAWHLALARVAKLSSGQWVVSGWQPQS
jgi:hypothetical protein